jgi:hypothetical protein
VSKTKHNPTIAKMMMIFRFIIITVNNLLQIIFKYISQYIIIEVDL